MEEKKATQSAENEELETKEAPRQAEEETKRRSKPLPNRKKRLKRKNVKKRTK